MGNPLLPSHCGDGPSPPFPEEKRLVLAVAFKKLFAKTAPVTAELSVLSILIVPNGTMFTMDDHATCYSANGPGMAKAIAHDKVEIVLYTPPSPPYNTRRRSSMY